MVNTFTIGKLRDKQILDMPRLFSIVSVFLIQLYTNPFILESLNMSSYNKYDNFLCLPDMTRAQKFIIL